MQRMFRLPAALLFTCLCIHAQSTDPYQIAQFFAAYQYTNTPGCAVGIDTPSHEPITAAYGMADLEHAIPNTTQTVFEAGSVSKQFTAAAVLLLVERGQISLEDEIHKYFPELGTFPKPVTVRHLLNHTSGLRDWGEIEYIAGWPRTTREYTHAHVLEILSRQHSLNYLPGDAWSYTNSGYNLAAMLVERVAGIKLQAFCKKEFFDPLGMSATQWRVDFRRVVPNRAIAYELNHSEWRQDMPFEDVYGNGGLLTDVDDLLKWNRNITNGNLHPAVFEAMQKPGSLNDGTKVGYGFGLFLTEFGGLSEVSHSGATAGYRAWLGRIPVENFSVAILCNAGNANTGDLAHKIARQLLRISEPAAPSVAADDVKPGLYRSIRDHAVMNVNKANGTVTFDGRSVHEAVRFEGEKMLVPNPQYGHDVWERVQPASAPDLNEFEGVYASKEADVVLRVAVEDGKLVIHRKPADSFTLKPTYKDAFSCSLANVHFLRNANGKVDALSLGTARVWDIRFTRHGGAATAE
jgi:CubicO group peptidase (beta-lactamase class C family)